MPKIKRETYKKRADNLIVFSQLPENHAFYAILSGRAEKFYKQGNCGKHAPIKTDGHPDPDNKGLLPFSYTEFVGLTPHALFEHKTKETKRVRSQRRKRSADISA